MAKLTVDRRGQVTLEKGVPQHLGIKPGDTIELNLSPNASGVLKATKVTGTIDGFIGLLAGCTEKVATLQEISEASAEGWAGRA